MDNEVKNQPQMIKFQCSVKNGQCEEPLAYNNIIDCVEHDKTFEGTWKYKSINGHQGPLMTREKVHKGSTYNVKVTWETGRLKNVLSAKANFSRKVLLKFSVFEPVHPQHTFISEQLPAIMRARINFAPNHVWYRLTPIWFPAIEFKSSKFCRKTQCLIFRKKLHNPYLCNNVADVAKMSVLWAREFQKQEWINATPKGQSQMQSPNFL